MESEKQIAVYFSNGKRATFKLSEFLLYPDYQLQTVNDLRNLGANLKNGITVINWDNVCFCRMVKDEEYEE